MISDVDRTTHKSKVESLLDMHEDIIFEMQCEAQYMENVIYQKLQFIQVIAKHENFFKDTAFYFVIGTHLYILWSFDTDGYVSEFTYTPYMQDKVRTTKSLAWVMLAFAT